jgi:hypothetical protein
MKVYYRLDRIGKIKYAKIIKIKNWFRVRIIELNLDSGILKRRSTE